MINWKVDLMIWNIPTAIVLMVEMLKFRK